MSKILEVVQHFHEAMTPQDKLRVWQDNAALLKAVKHVEMEQRKICAELFFGTHEDGLTGTQKYQLGNGWELKGSYGWETKLDETVFAAIRDTLPVNIVDHAVKFKASLNASGYKSLHEDDKEKLESAIVVKPKTVTLDIVPPKVKKE